MARTGIRWSGRRCRKPAADARHGVIATPVTPRAATRALSFAHARVVPAPHRRPRHCCARVAGRRIARSSFATSSALRSSRASPTGATRASPSASSTTASRASGCSAPSSPMARKPDPRTSPTRSARRRAASRACCSPKRSMRASAARRHARQGLRRCPLRRSESRIDDDRRDRRAPRRPSGDRLRISFRAASTIRTCNSTTAALQRVPFACASRMRPTSAQYRYSDLGIALLGEAVARVYRKRLSQPARFSEVLAPLAFDGSGFRQRAAPARWFRDGKPTPHWQYQSFAPASGLRASLADLSRFAAAQLRPDTSPLRAAILLAREPRAAPAAARPRSHGRSCRSNRTAKVGRCSGRPASPADSRASSAFAPTGSARSSCSATPSIDLSALGLAR